MKHILTFIYLVLTISHTFSQEAHWENQLLQQTNGNKVIRWEQASNDASIWLAVLKFKKKIGIYDVHIDKDYQTEGQDSSYVSMVYQSIKPKYDQIDFFKLIKEEDSELVDELQGLKTEVAEVSIEKKKGIIVRYGDDYDKYYLKAKDFFQSIDWKNNKGTLVPVKHNDLWGIYNWYKQTFLFECVYKTKDKLPKTTSSNGFDKYSAEIFYAFNKVKDKEKIDLIDLDRNNGDGLFKARSATSKKWGLFQYLGNEIIEAIPMSYDSLYHFSWNGNYTAVFNNGKVGFYLSYWSYNEYARQTIPCIYEDYKRYVTEDQTPKLAVQKEGKWGWVNWLTGEEKSEFKYTTPDDLPYPYYKQEIWLNE